MARFLDVHPDNPQPRLLEQVVGALRDEDALIAYPTDSGYALGCRIGNRDGRERILRIRWRERSSSVRRRSRVKI